MKIVLIGAGSFSFGRGQIVDILTCRELQDKGVTLSLVDTNAEALELMVRLAERMREHYSANITIESSTDRCQALPNADYVLIAVAAKRMPLWEQDFRVPLSYGFRHCLGENGGPGALFHALRSFKLIMPICQDVERLCPNALLMNFTNPEARVLNAIQTLTKVRAIGLCHGVLEGLDFITHYLKRPIEELDVAAAGMNHLYTLLHVRDKKTGQDLKGELFEKILDDDSGHAPPLFKKLIEIFGVMSYPSDDHIGEYFSFGTEYHGTKWPYGRECRKVLRETKSLVYQDGTFNEEIRENTHFLLKQYVSGKRPLDNDILAPSDEIATEVIVNIELGHEFFIPSVNTMNTPHYISNLPKDGIVEVPAKVDATGVHPQSVGEIPEPLAAVIRTHFAIHKLLVEAYRTKSKKLLLQALLLDPVVNSVTAAEHLLDDMLDLQADFLPDFS